MTTFSTDNQQKIIVITGASRGVGKELVLRFAKNKTNLVFALSRNIEEMEEHFSNFNNVICGFIDLASEDLHQQLSVIFNQYQRIDILINNAGKLIKGGFLNLSRNEINDSYQTNAIGTIFATQYFIPKMIKKGGHIVNISTMGAFQGSVKFPELSAYSSSKAAITNFTELFAEEFKGTKIKMNCLCLGSVQTEMFEQAFPHLKAAQTPEESAEFIADFAIQGQYYFNGKIIPVSSSTP